MALQDITPALSYSDISDDRLTGTITDGTTYGGANPARGVLDVFMTGYKMKFDSSIDSTLTVTSNSGSARTVTSWTFNLPKDGWFRFPFVAIAAYAGGTTYAIYDAVYNSATDIVYRSLQNSNVGHTLTDPSWWEVITDPSSLALNYGETNQSNNIASDIYEIIVTANSEYAFASQIALESQMSSDADVLKQLPLYLQLQLWVNDMYVHSDRSEFSQGERVARRTQTVAVEAGLL